MIRIGLSQHQIHGVDLDPCGRCRHWHSDRDVVGIRFKCCGRYYACYECHQELADHPAQVWPHEEFGVKALLCGVCGHELTIAEYLELEPYSCPQCGQEFNPGCRLHKHLYFAEP